MSLPLSSVTTAASPSIGERPGIDAGALARLLCELGRVERLADLGRGGPLVAAAGAGARSNCLFARAAIRMAMDLLEDFPAVARATIVELARLQGVRRDPRAEEEPGRILHEDRPQDDPHRAPLEANWTFPYYGAVDSTPQWINLLAAYCAQEGHAILVEEIVDRLGRRQAIVNCLLAAIDWIVGRLDDPAGGGYLWVRRTSPTSIANQVWEDSVDSYYHADGTLFDFRRPYAPIAVQGYAYDALLGAADLLEQVSGAAAPCPDCGRGGDSTGLRAQAAALRARTLRELWQPDLGTFALALTFDNAGRSEPARVVASSPGHLLASRLLDGGDVAAIRERLIARLFEDDLLAGAGIRTRAV